VDAGPGDTRRRRNGKPQKGDSGSPGEPEAGHTEDAGGEETRNRIGRGGRGERWSSNLWVHFIETPETTVSGVSIVGDQAGSWKRKFKSGKKIQVSVEPERKPSASPAGE